MFQIGDKVLYPMQGVGIIETIEEKEVLGKKKLYYTLNMPQINMQVMIPTERASALGIRQIVEPDILESVLTDFHLGNTDPIIYEDKRYCRDLNKSKIKTGDIYKGTEIIRDLMRKSQKNKLGSEDTNMLNNARRMFISEVMQVKGIAQEQADHLLDEVLLIQLT
ncbi:CarD family transcriptional regulator [Desulfosporosinus nitroreducens]|uniref:CarD family transcriptional regulator n=1 Tax=Desulfosporosinus nitroreducens TaxID=2018668 RepID=A0ABT8QMW2_9FIRM|nr:CarD family transcriptional regulator [Desulfosporosinus nitroreducens]MCO1603265.1 CarD family transcriptional regulator [Desulfosporosinus nitroreducens]MDO0822672.1 CarD family transcriptional regulator [Desulfosporosinus nitroreducens]